MMRRLLLALVPLLIVAGLLEVVLRGTHLFNARLAWTEPDRDIGWRFTPGREYWFFAENDHPIEGRINAMGWRDRAREPRPAPGTFRVAVIGDSFVEAFQVELDSTFTAIAERRLAGAGAAVEVMNFGRSGTSPVEAAIVLDRDVFATQPDLVVFVFTPHNDVADVNPATATSALRPFVSFAGDSMSIDRSFARTPGFRLREWINPVKQRIVLISFFTERYNVWRQMRARDAQRALPGGDAESRSVLTRERRLCTAAPDSVFAANYALCKTLVASMADACRRRQAAFAVLSVPLVHEREVEAQVQHVDASFRMGLLDDDLAAMADSSAFFFAPLTAAFARRHETTGEKLYWSHWNYAGHRAVSGVLADLVGQARTAKGRGAGGQHDD